MWNGPDGNYPVGAAGGSPEARGGTIPGEVRPAFAPGSGEVRHGARHVSADPLAFYKLLIGGELGEDADPEVVYAQIRDLINVDPTLVHEDVERLLQFLSEATGISPQEPEG